MLSLKNAGKRFGPRVLFLEANWLIRAREKTALVGANGAGKSTLMKVLAGLESLNYGPLQHPPGRRGRCVPQHDWGAVRHAEGTLKRGRRVYRHLQTVPPACARRGEGVFHSSPSSPAVRCAGNCADKCPLR